MNHLIEEGINKSTSRRVDMNLYKINFTCTNYNFFTDNTVYIACESYKQGKEFLTEKYSHVEFLTYHKIDNAKVENISKPYVLRIRENFSIPYGTAGLVK